MATTDAQADYLVDRRKLRGRVSFWRVMAFLAAFIAIIAIGLRLAGPNLKLGGPHIARVAIKGLIVGDDETLKTIRAAGEATSAAAVVFAIDSPGGTTTGSDRIFQEIRLVAAKKPVVAVVGTLAASGAYVAALGTDQIFANGNSLVGSIGVLFQYPNVTKLLDTLGVKMEEIKSSPLKAAPNGLEPTSPEARAALAVLVTDSYEWFKGLVKERRHLSDAELAAVSDGRVFTARMGLPLKLVDRLGGEREAIAWLETEKNIGKGLPVQDYKAEASLGRFGIFGASADMADWSGLHDFAKILRHAQGSADAQALDGLVAIWHGGN